MTPRQATDAAGRMAQGHTLPHPGDAPPHCDVGAQRSPGNALDEESRRWLHDLAGSGHAHDDAVRRLDELLLRAARFEVSRRRNVLAYLRGGDHDNLARNPPTTRSSRCWPSSGPFAATAALRLGV